MTAFDFIMLYEHKVRELENLCLLKYELESRGYSVKIMYIDDAKNALAVKPVYYAKVLLVMACYNNQTLYWHTKEFVKFEKVIDLQWENIVYPKDENREGAFKNYSGIGGEVVRISWGPQNFTRMLDVVKMDPKKIKVTGHIGMDFLRRPLTNYYLGREELLTKYNIPTDKKIILFASPYFGDDLNDVYKADMCNRFGDDWIEYYDFMCKSQEIVLKWIEKVCRHDNELFLIFRPHPGHPSKMAAMLEKQLDNFRVIDGESVKQWIIASDKIYTGNSSVIVEAFFAEKMCQILCPVPVTKGFELKLISEAEKITEYDAFYKSLYSDAEKFPVKQSGIEEIYLVDWATFNYVKLADAAEEVLMDDYYKLSKRQLKSYLPKLDFKTKVIKNISRISPLYNIYLRLLEDKRNQWGFLKSQRKLREKVVQIEKDHSYELTTEQEIYEIVSKISKALNNKPGGK